VFSYAHRKRLAEHAYQTTRADLRARRDELAPLLARHGLKLRSEVIEDRERRLADGLRNGRTRATARLGGALDDLGGMLRARKSGSRSRPPA